jgi:hypothetical protein
MFVGAIGSARTRTAVSKVREWWMFSQFLVVHKTTYEEARATRRGHVRKEQHYSERERLLTTASFEGRLRCVLEQTHRLSSLVGFRDHIRLGRNSIWRVRTTFQPMAGALALRWAFDATCLAAPGKTPLISRVTLVVTIRNAFRHGRLSHTLLAPACTPPDKTWILEFAYGSVGRDDWV